MRLFITLLSVILSLGSCLILVDAKVTGQRVCSVGLCITGLHDDTAKTDTYTITGPDGTNIPASQFGWAGIGFGSAMAQSPMVVAWPNQDQSFTLGQYSPAQHDRPPLNTSPSRLASLQNSQSFANSTSTSITFTLPSDDSALSGPTALIWAYSSRNPGSSSPDASFARHDTFGRLSLDLGASLSSGGTAQSGTSETANTEGPNRRAVIAHMVIGGIVTMIIIPFAVLVPRFARGLTTKRWWLPVHSGIAGVLAFALVAVTFIIAASSFGVGFSDTHTRLGLVMFIIMIVQVLLGVGVYLVKKKGDRFKTKSGRGPIHFVHVVLGLSVVGVGFATTYTGLTDQYSLWSGTSNSALRGWIIAFGVLAGIFVLAYFIGLIVLLPRQRKLEREAREIREVEKQHGSVTELVK